MDLAPNTNNLPKKLQSDLERMRGAQYQNTNHGYAEILE